MFMPILSLTAVARGPVRVREEVPGDHPVWLEAGLALARPLRLDLEARTVGDGVLVRGGIDTALRAECRRCLSPVEVSVSDTVDLLYEAIEPEDEAALGGEVYPLPDRGDVLDLLPALRDELVLRSPDYVLCSESCRGLCPSCGADLSRSACECVPETGDSPWSALKEIKFD